MDILGFAEGTALSAGSNTWPQFVNIPMAGFVQ
jgi:hypothetical protein